MDSQIQCNARVLINGNLNSNSILAWIDPNGNYLYLNIVGIRKSLVIKPFTPQMISQCSSGNMKAGRDFTLSGTDIGYWNSGPKGHPGDCEFDSWSLKSVTIHICYTTSQVILSISGITEEGASYYIGQPDPNQPLPLPPLLFELEFSVLRHQLKQFLQIQDKYYQSFEDELDRLTGL